MVEFDKKNFLQILKDLSKDEMIPIPLNDQLCAEIEMIIYIKPALEELFGAAIRDDLESCNPKQMMDIVEEYAIALRKSDAIIERALKESIDEESFAYIACRKNNIYFNYDQILKSILIYKK